MYYFIIDCGNTFSKIYTFNADLLFSLSNYDLVEADIEKIAQCIRIQNSDIINSAAGLQLLEGYFNNLFQPGLYPGNSIRLLAASVKPEVFEKLDAFISEFFSKMEITIIKKRLAEKGWGNKIKFGYRPLSSYGEDRIALLYYTELIEHCFPEIFGEKAVFDNGTALTIDLISENRYKGGYILPSMIMNSKALHYFTAQLEDFSEDLISLYSTEEFNEKTPGTDPFSGILPGYSTGESIVHGLYFQFTSLVLSFITQSLAECRGKENNFLFIFNHGFFNYKFFKVIEQRIVELLTKRPFNNRWEKNVSFYLVDKKMDKFLNPLIAKEFRLFHPVGKLDAIPFLKFFFEGKNKNFRNPENKFFSVKRKRTGNIGRFNFVFLTDPDIVVKGLIRALKFDDSVHKEIHRGIE